MADIKSLNGYNLKDAVAREQIADLQEAIDNIDFPEQVNADWSVSDSESASYIKNRPFYDNGTKLDIISLLDEVTVTISEDGGCETISNEMPKITVGNTYVVVLNGVRYDCEAWSGDAVMLGNGEIYGGDGGNGEPFSCDWHEDGECYLNVAEAGTYTISIGEEREVKDICKIEAKYLTQPDWNDNDDTSAAYIQNRPFYDAGSVNTILAIEKDVNVNTQEVPEGWTRTQTNMAAWDYKTTCETIGIPSNPSEYIGSVFTFKSFNNVYEFEIDDSYVTSNGLEVGINSGDLMKIDMNGNLTLSMSGNAVSFVPSCYEWIVAFSDIHKIDEKYLPDSVMAKSDWNVNDETSPAYIQNRPFYTGDVVETVIVDNFIDTYADPEGYGALWNTNELPFYDLIRGETYTVVWDGVPYECVAVDDGYGGEALGNFVAVGETTDTGEPFFIYEEENGEWSGICANEAGEHTVSILQSIVEVKKLDVKYQSSPDWNENNESIGTHIKNRTHFSRIGRNKLVSNKTINFESAIQSIETDIEIPDEVFQIGDKCFVTWDGVEYECNVDTSFTRYVGNQAVCSFYIQNNPENTGEPFCIYSLNGVVCISAAEAGEHTFSIAVDKMIMQVVYEPDYMTCYCQNKLDVPIVNGDTYIVTLNDFGYYYGEVTYTVVAHNNFSEGVLVGNDDVWFEFFEPNDTIDPPFAFNDSSFVMVMPQQDMTFTISIEQIHKIDKKYINGGVGASGTGLHAEIFNNYELDSELASRINIASGDFSHAEGLITTASGSSSHAEGYDTTASGGESHAEGSSTTASGSSSHAEGRETTASANCSHAEGQNTTASGEGAHAEGYFTIAASEYQHVQGQYNIEDTEGKYAHIVGNGDWETPANAHTLDWKGNGWYAGSLFVGGTSQDNADKVLTDSDLSRPRYSFALTDVVNGSTYVVEMRNGNLVSRCAVESIEVTTMPHRTEYEAGERFDSTGMVITATCQDGSRIEIKNYECDTIVKSSNINISYVEAGKIHTTTVQVTATEFDAESMLVDFEYTVDNDGFYTITSWKGTLNGEPSTEMIVPDNGLIRL